MTLSKHDRDTIIKLVETVYKGTHESMCRPRLEALENVYQGLKDKLDSRDFMREDSNRMASLINEAKSITQFWEEKTK